MKKTLLLTLLAVAIASIALLTWKFCSCSSTCSTTEVKAGVSESGAKKGGGPGNPGWFEQNLRMKKNREGVIPRGVTSRILKQEAARKVASTGLTNISNLGPDNIGGRTRAMIIDVNNHSRFIAAGVSGGVWESTNKGVNWTPLTDQSLTLSVTFLAQDPNAPSNMYFSTGEPRGNSAGIPGAGIFKSTDGGATWAQLPATDIAAFDYNWRVVVDPTTANEVYVGTRYNGLYRSTDGGASFDQVFYNAPETNVTDIEIFPDGSLIIGVNGQGIFRSPNGNSGTFTESTSGLPVNSFRRVEIAYCDSFPNVVWTAYEDSVTSTYYTGLYDVWKSTDSGITWTDVANPDDDFGYFFSFPWYSTQLAVKPDAPNTVILGVGDITYTTDGGTTWTATAYSHVDNHIAAFDKDDDDVFYAGNDGGLYSYDFATIDLDVQDLNNAYRVTQYYAGNYFPTGNAALTGAQDNGTHKFTGLSPDIDIVFWGDGSYCAVNQQDANVSFVSYQNGTIHRADDSWMPTPTYYDVYTCTGLDLDCDGSIDDGAWFINPFEIHLGDGDQLYFSTQERVFRTIDGGLSWSPLTYATPGSESPYAIGIAHQSANPTVYIGGEQGLFYRVLNAKTAAEGSETDLSSSVPASVSNDFISCITVNPLDDGTVYVAFSNYSSDPRVWKVTGAKTASPVWTDISGDLPVELPVNWIQVHPDAPDDYYVAATDNGLYVSTNGGSSWVKETSIPNVSIHQIRLRSDRRLFIPTHGRGLWVADVPPMVNMTDAPSFTGMRISPNPAADFITVELPASATADDCSILDASGKQVMRILRPSALQHISVAHLAPGIYFVRAGGEVKRFVKM